MIERQGIRYRRTNHCFFSKVPQFRSWRPLPKTRLERKIILPPDEKTHPWPSYKTGIMQKTPPFGKPFMSRHTETATYLHRSTCLLYIPNLFGTMNASSISPSVMNSITLPYRSYRVQALSWFKTTEVSCVKNEFAQNLPKIELQKWRSYPSRRRVECRFWICTPKLSNMAICSHRVCRSVKLRCGYYGLTEPYPERRWRVHREISPQFF